MLKSELGSAFDTNEIEPLLVTVPKGCRISGLGRSKLYELLASGTVQSVLVGRRRLIKYSSLKQLAERGAQ